MIKKKVKKKIEILLHFFLLYAVSLQVVNSRGSPQLSILFNSYLLHISHSPIQAVRG